MLAVLRRLPVDEVPEAPDALPAEVVPALRRRRAAHEEELLAADERGRLLLALRRERWALPETVWLAGTLPALQAVWRRLLGLLGREPTALQPGSVKSLFRSSTCQTMNFLCRSSRSRGSGHDR
jgi:hypothetical protein